MRKQVNVEEVFVLTRRRACLDHIQLSIVRPPFVIEAQLTTVPGVLKLSEAAPRRVAVVRDLLGERSRCSGPGR
ncbi:hypothetical protein Ato02nite_048180 [Paractinoplanes toevensis]|uniref:Uncharacterized protein n=1 Tax=Paractinoplanes toevensis TaxID=571911 RepID=A0A919TEP0_9ACTN|nr:hypothetical protein Ato02nite_048180 [Actinoplanes toevensis]